MTSMPPNGSMINAEEELFTCKASSAQQRLWLIDQLTPSQAYNIRYAWRLKGQLHMETLKRALDEIVLRHETLRTCFVSVEEQLMQVVHPEYAVELPMVDLRTLPLAERETQVAELVAEEASRPFDLSQLPLLRAKLLCVDAEDHVLVLTIHHIISDGWSLGVFFDELTQIYNAYLEGLESPLPELPIQYVDYSAWQEEQMEGDALEDSLSYWREQLGGRLPVLQLPTDRPRPPVQTYGGNSKSFLVSKELTEALKKMSQNERATLFMTMLAAYQTLLLRYTGQEDIVVGTPIAGRTRPEIEGLIGCFVNTLALRTDLSGGITFRELLTRVRDVSLDATKHGHVPFEKLVEVLQPERDLSHAPIFQTLFAFQNMPMRPLGLTGLEASYVDIPFQATKFDLSLELIENEHGINCYVEYKTDLFDEATIDRLIANFQVLIRGIVKQPDQRLVDLPLLTEEERHQVLSVWNDTKREVPLAPNSTIHQLFEAQAARTPDATAVVFAQARLTYADLNNRANQLAHKLQSLGVGPDQFVGVCMSRTPEMIVALLAVLKAGGAYVPLDPAYPQDRVAFMMNDAQAKVLLTQAGLLSQLPEHRAQVLCLDQDWAEIAEESTENLHSPVTVNDLAYVIYTSGSTGQPKGVAIEHRSAVTFCQWARETFTDEEMAGVLFSTSICFDLSVFELFVTLSLGGKVIVAENALHVPKLPAAQEVTLINTVPSAITELVRMNAIPLSVRTINLAGEPLKKALVDQLYGVATLERVYNLYGPSEDTTYSTFTLVPRGTASVTIGRPLANTQVYLLDPQLQPVPIGVAGELHLGGDGLARGYLDRPDLTAEKFIADPFSVDEDARLYKTGDLARYLPDGNIEYLGRIDHQVKIRGFRIELGEVEATLAKHPHVLETVVVAQDSEQGEQRLVAYLVAGNGGTPTVTELRDFIQRQLPAYMVPSVFVTLDAMPLTPNGKIDRKALPAPDGSEQTGRPEYVAPRTEEETLLAQIWGEVLGVEQVGVHDQFFALGGHSLLATQIITRVRSRLSVELSMQTIFETTTLADLAQALVLLRQGAPVTDEPVIIKVSRTARRKQ